MVLDIVATILGVLFTIRKLDAQRRTQKEFSHVSPEDFDVWQRAEVSAYGTGMMACFAKVLGDIFLVFVFGSDLPFNTLRALTAAIDLSWFVLVLLTFYRGIRLARRRAELRIVLGGFVVESGGELSTELKAALRRLQDGDVDRALYEIKQVILDSDDSLRAIALYWLGEAYLRKGDEGAARDAFQESMEEDPSLTQPREAVEKLDRKAKAQSDDASSGDETSDSSET